MKHGCGRIAFHDGLASGLRIIVGFHGVHEVLEIKILILKRVSQFVCKYHLLGFCWNPVGQVHRLGARIVKSGGLLGVKADEELFQVKAARNQAEGPQGGLLHVEFLGSVLGMQVANQEFPDFRTAHDPLLQR